MNNKEAAKVVLSYPSPFGFAVFVVCPSRSFVIYMDKYGGGAIQRALNKTSSERPLTHDFISDILDGLDVSIKEVVIYKEEDGTFFSRFVISMKNELGEKIVEIDSRPSDALSLAITHNAPVFVEKNVLDKLQDVSDIIEEIQKKNIL